MNSFRFFFVEIFQYRQRSSAAMCFNNIDRTELLRALFFTTPESRSLESFVISVSLFLV